MAVKRFLDVGAAEVADETLPKHFAGWQRVRLDIDPRAKPDILLDGRELKTLPAASYDAAYCSHNLEHYWEHDVPKVLAGLRHVVKPEGFVHLRVPHLEALFRYLVANKQGVDAVLYRSPAGPIRALDVIYGHAALVRKGQEGFAHRTGFTPRMLAKLLKQAGFAHWLITPRSKTDLHAYAFPGTPGPGLKALLKF